eukprot:3988507-Prymnesium_polylepis.1
MDSTADLALQGTDTGLSRAKHARAPPNTWHSGRAHTVATKGRVRGRAVRSPFKESLNPGW